MRGGPAAAVVSELMSRRPSMDMCSVRGMGVAVIVRMSTLTRKLFEAFLVLDAEPLLFVDDQQAQVLEVDVVAEQPVRADEDIDLPSRARARMSLACLGGLEAVEDFDR